MEAKRKKILQIIRKYMYNKSLAKKATPDSNIIKDLKINSARIVDIVLDIEDEFRIEIENKALSRIQTVNDIALLVEELKSGEAGNRT